MLVGARVIDACVGEGAVAEMLMHNQFEVVTNDIDKKRRADYHMDARDPKLYKKAAADWWITNPPFDIIDDILMAAVQGCTNVVTLARLSVLEPTSTRRVLYKYYQPDMLIVLPRYCFRLNDKGKRATDSVTCAWIGWGPEVPRITTVWTEPPPEQKEQAA
jgi:hypothetical protein